MNREDFKIYKFIIGEKLEFFIIEFYNKLIYYNSI